MPQTKYCNADMQIVLASHNKHKQEELSVMLSGLVEVLKLPDDFPDIEETGTELSENAIIKARAVFLSIRIPTLSDDTGLEVEALGGAPGVYTARYAGENATYSDNCKKLLQELDGITNRKAVFKTALCYIDKNETEYLFEGIVRGSISMSEKGEGGFGYDPVFIPDTSDGLTFAEMSTEEKNLISHRARAIQSFVEWLKEL